MRLLSEIGGIDTATVADSASFDNELEMKSIIFVELQVALEDELDIEIDPLHVLDLNRLDRVVDYIYGLVLLRGTGTSGEM